MTRDDKGRFIKGNGGGPGRPKKEREQDYMNIMASVVTPDRWRSICEKAAAQAERGDNVARKFLADYLIGPPVQKNEHSGPDGAGIKIVVEYADANPDAS